MLNRRSWLLGATGVLASFAQDWSQWRGANRDGAIPAVAAVKWPESLKRLWNVSVGEGHSSPVASGKRIVQFARRGDAEVIYAFDADSGKKLWEHSWRQTYVMNPAAFAHGKGPKSTPVVHAGRVHALGISGMLTCVRLETGAPVWNFQTEGKFRSGSPTFGTAMSPAVYNGLLIAHVGTDNDGALTAFDPASGRIRWQWKGQGPAYASPVLAGGNQLVTFSAEKLLAVNIADGELLWELPFTTPYSQNSVTPFVYRDMVIYSGLQQPVTAIRVGGGKPQKIWETREVGMYMNSPVLAAGLLHGLSHRNRGQYFSLDPASGKVVWTSDGRQTENAALIARGNEVYSLTTESELHVFSASARGLSPVRKYSVADSPTWAHPLITANRVYVKDKDSLALWSA